MVRPLLSLIVLAALVIALLQGVGRVAFALLEHLEVATNQLLAGRHIHVSGMHGAWRGFNPVVRIARLELPAGHLEDIYVEVDLLESLFRSRLVLHRARVADGMLLLEKAEGAGWRLAGMPAGNGFDPLPLLTGTDQLQFHGSLGFTRDQLPTAVLEVDYVGTNRDDAGRYRLIARNVSEDCAAPCELKAQVQTREGTWPLDDGETLVTLSATNFQIARPLLGAAAVQLDAVEVDWHGNEEQSGGRALLLANGTLGTDERPFSARLSAVSRGRDGRHWGQVTRFEVAQDGQRLDLPGLDFSVRDGVLYASLQALPVAELTGMLKSLTSRNEVASRWLEALALDARVDDLRAFYRFATHELGYGFTLAGFSMDGYKGVPLIRGGVGSVIGFTRVATGRPQFDVGHAVQVDIDASDMVLAFPEHVHGQWALPYVRGRLQAWFRRDELGMRGLDLATRIGDSELRGGVGISRFGKYDQDRRIAALATVDHITVAEARRFVPFVLQPRLYDWLTNTPMDGVMRDARVAYQGQFRVPPRDPGRRLEIAGDVEGGRLRFHPDWPEVQGFAGFLEVAGREVRAAARAATMLGADLAGSRVLVSDNAARADVTLAARVDASAGLELVRQSPLRKWLSFVAPDWTGSGPLRLSGELGVPLRGAGQSEDDDAAGPAANRPVAQTPDGLALDLAVDLEGVDLELPGYRLDFGKLTGPLRYRYPATLGSDGITGTLFDAPVQIGADSVDNRFRLSVSGTARDGDFWRVIDIRGPDLAEGRALFDAVLDVEAPAGTGIRRTDAPPPRLSIRSNLEGMAVRLPGEYAKPADEAVPTEAELLLPGDEMRLTFSYRDARGWLRFAKRLEQGMIGLGVEPQTLADDVREVVFTGRINRVGLDDLALGSGSTMPLPVPVRMRDFEADKLVIGSLVIPDAQLEGSLQADGFDLRVMSEDLTGSARRRIDPQAAADAAPAPIDLDIENLHLPAGSEERDPLSVEIIRSIPALNVVIAKMTVGDADYGRWKFELRQEAGDLWFRNMETQLRKVDIVTSDGVVWRGATNETTFTGELKMANLAEVLPLWGYAPSVETEEARLTGTMTWPGSPASFKLFALHGTADVRAKTGRFLDVESGGGTQRILSLLNFTTIAKRISLDFSDVFGKGLSFDKLKATFTLNDGMLELVRPLDVEGTGLKFKLTGKTSLPDRVLDHEMVVTLPVSRGLPWYAAYVALANPIAGLGVLVGERVLRKPLEQFSSARYRITGTVESPQVKLVSVFAASGHDNDRPVEVPVDQAGSASGITVPEAGGAASTEDAAPAGGAATDASPAEPQGAPVEAAPGAAKRKSRN